MIIRPFVRDFYVYIDDGGLPELNLPGFAYLMADQFTANAIRQSVCAAKKTFGLRFLHANEIKKRNYRDYRQAYERVFTDAILELRRSNWGDIVCRYGTTDENGRVQSFVRDSLTKILNERQTTLHQNMKRVTEIAEYILFPLMALTKIKTINRDDSVNIHVVMDKKKRFDTDIERIIECSGNLHSGLISIKHLTKIIINVWFDKVYPVLTGQKLDFQIDSVEILPAWKDPVLEFVDALAHFSFQFFKCSLENYHVSEVERHKSSFFQEILIQVNPEIDIGDMRQFIKDNWSFSNGKVISLTAQHVYVLNVRGA